MNILVIIYLFRMPFAALNVIVQTWNVECSSCACISYLRANNSLTVKNVEEKVLREMIRVVGIIVSTR